ncbi:Gaa1-like protein [Neohortaea acidophila]|uniref:Gaa1-like protein n=1 Tax=Neohortaea acidophila TaxID=245834 RepID=A0A6A6PRW7_9PEZI|nr:Gaa1-like protein [Neohortaea acidophila]KAF2481967.1 Gaa1-like protein [Neohortaea acidophila]
MGLLTRLLTARSSPVLLRLPPYLSALCIIAGAAWLLVLPLEGNPRATYISENAILPGQVHTYFGGSEHNVFRAYRQEVWQLSQRSDHDRIAGLEQILQENGLKAAAQPYSWQVAGEEIAGTNVYGLIQGPRADATEAMVLIAAWRNFAGDINYSGVALVLTLARYLKRWSIWSKDIVVLIPDDSTYGPEAWVSAYHSTTSTVTSTRNITSLPIKAGALQGAVAIDYPAGPWGQRFEKIDVVYDGINGALPNLDLLNTAINIANNQMGVESTLHNVPNHQDNYLDRLTMLTKGLITQSVGHATGPHSAFMPYHIDAITLRTVGDGWHDEMTLGRTAESMIRSINNLLEHLHQSFFFYVLLGPYSFVSIGNYLPAAVIVAGGLTVTALAMWIRSGKAAPSPAPGKKQVPEKLEVLTDGDVVAVVPKSELETHERKMFLPALILVGVHLGGFVPLYLLNNISAPNLPLTFYNISAVTLILPLYLATHIARHTSPQQLQTLQSFSLLLLGATLSTLATLNFSLAFLVGLLCSPLSFARPLPRLPLLQFPTKATPTTPKPTTDPVAARLAISLPAILLYIAISPPAVLLALNAYFGKPLAWTLLEMAKGWCAQGVWTSLVIWAVWWPAWVVGGTVMLSGTFRAA